MPSFEFARRSVRSIVSLTALLGGAAFAVPASAASSNAPLPQGVHRTKSGRYLEDMCKDVSKPHCLGKWLLPETWQPTMPLPDRHSLEDAVPQASGTCTGSKTGMSPTDITTAYNIPSSASANGKIVALIDLADKTAFTDVTGYRAGFSLPTLPQCATVPGGVGTTACFAQVDSETGKPTTPTKSVSTDADGETGLDMAMVSAACPDCSILLVGISSTNENLTGDNGWQGFVDAVATAKKLGASAISISFGGPENTDPNVISTGQSDGGADTSGVYTAAGQPVFVASGDFAYDNENIAVSGSTPGKSPSYPSSAPDVIAVGGTMLFSLGSSKYDEAVWDDGTFSTSSDGQDVTTSGCSTEFAMPSWQSSVLSGSGCSKRATADIAAAAAFSSGTTSEGIPSCTTGKFGAAEGTSAASPMVAAIMTRLGLTDAIGGNIGWIYDNGAAFNDLGSSAYPVSANGSDTDSNTTGCGKLCTAGAGWDGPSGMGTPNGVKLAATGGASGSSSSSSSSSGGGTSSSSGSSSGSGTSSSSSSSSGGGGGGGGGSGGSTGTSSSSSSSSSGGTNGSSSGITIGTEDSGVTTVSDEDGGSGFSTGGGNSGSGCSVVSGGDSSSGLGLFGASFGFVALLGARRRRNQKK